jgi:hypothetical protein
MLLHNSTEQTQTKYQTHKYFLFHIIEQSYQDYNCPAGEEHLQCPVDPEMTITATTHATW